MGRGAYLSRPGPIKASFKRLVRGGTVARMSARPGTPWMVLSGVLLVWSNACTGVEDDQPSVPARPGATQEGGTGSPRDEDEACARIRDAEEDKRKKLNCPDLERASCPEYVRPAGGGCWTYPEQSVSACETKIRSYVACADFEDQPCILTATPADASACDGASEGGAGGTPSDAGRGGSSAGRGGAGGRGGSTANPGGESGLGGEAGA
jgi:hypothetical protein